MMGSVARCLQPPHQNHVVANDPQHQQDVQPVVQRQRRAPQPRHLPRPGQHARHHVDPASPDAQTGVWKPAQRQL